MMQLLLCCGLLASFRLMGLCRRSIVSEGHKNIKGKKHPYSTFTRMDMEKIWF